MVIRTTASGKRKNVKIIFALYASAQVDAQGSDRFNEMDCVTCFMKGIA